MSLSSHLTELKKKHRALEQSIKELENSPSARSDAIEIRELKKQKLRLKQQIARHSGKLKPNQPAEPAYSSGAMPEEAQVVDLSERRPDQTQSVADAAQRVVGKVAAIRG